jgi:hypothetical protein
MADANQHLIPPPLLKYTQPSQQTDSRLQLLLLLLP